MNQHFTMLCHSCFNMTTAIAVVLAAICGMTSSQSCDLAYVDQCATEFFMLGFSNKTFRQPSDFQEFCRNAHQGGQCVLDFAHRCVQREVETSIDILVKGYDSVIVWYCDRPGAVEEFMQPDHQSCAAQHFSSQNTCIRKLVSDMEAASTASAVNAMALACCFFYEYEDCYDNKMSSETSDCLSYLKKSRFGIGSQLFIDGCVESREECKNLEVVDRSTPPTFKTHIPPLIHILKKVYKE